MTVNKESVVTVSTSRGSLQYDPRLKNLDSSRHLTATHERTDPMKHLSELEGKSEETSVSCYEILY